MCVRARVCVCVRDFAPVCCDIPATHAENVNGEKVGAGTADPANCTPILDYLTAVRYYECCDSFRTMYPAGLHAQIRSWGMTS